ncbi:hypothetical protein BSKO_03430 [Bryopsis sp. KO-2023]|nr:hypothetical protein BSKO_03430 [Bryopsis sp. KO-2023]
MRCLSLGVGCDVSCNMNSKPRLAVQSRSLGKNRALGSSFLGKPLVGGNSSHSLAPTRRSIETQAYKVDVGDRVLASIPYFLPLFDGLRYGRYFLTQFPIFTRLLSPISPLYQIFQTVPFASVVVFFGVYLGLVQNQNLSRFVRFNAMQAVLVDILLIFPSLVESIFRPNGDILVMGYNTIWLYVFACIVYGIGSCLMGESPRLPLVADAADAQIR